MVKYAQYMQNPDPENYYENIKGVKTTTKSLGIMEMVNYDNDCNENITDYIYEDDTYSYASFGHRKIIKTKDDKIQRFTSYHLNNNKLFLDYLCEDGKVILAKKYDDQGNLIGFIQKIDKIN